MITAENIKLIEALARLCGDTMKTADRSDCATRAKEGHANFVTRYDRIIEDILYHGLLDILPEAAFYGEESADGGFPSEDLVFVVDPIDGTTNFIKDLKWSCVSIGLTEKRERIYGLVYNPYTDEMFTAVKGQGAFLNGKEIHVSDAPLEEALVIFGTAPYYEDLADHAFQKAQEYMMKGIDVRRTGSAALDLCLVACGRAELYFESMLQPWDFAAGSLIAEEAGGTVKRWDGEALDVTMPGSCLAYGSGISLDRL